MWQKIWFISNMGFVATLIWYMFLQRAYADALHRKDSPELLARHRRRRTFAAIGAILLFLLMAAAFLTNMRVNG